MMDDIEDLVPDSNRLEKLKSDQVLRNYVLDLLTLNPSSKEEVRKMQRQLGKKHRIHPPNSELLRVYRDICKKEKKKGGEDERFVQMLQKKSFRSQSGVMVYAVLTHPEWRDEGEGSSSSSSKGGMKSFACKYDCHYCPQQPDRPRSYVDGEPGLDRAVSVGFDTVEQIHSRAGQYTATGHPVDKAEVIVLGGTWHSYPLEYRNTFCRDVYYAFNTIKGGGDRARLSLAEEMELNERSECRVIGLTIETRPDQLTTASEMRTLRTQGVTRVQLGVQHTDDRLLLRINRLCYLRDTVNAIRTLKDCGFKVDIHLMPDLPKPFTQAYIDRCKREGRDVHARGGYSRGDIDWGYDSVAEDRRMLARVLEEEALQVDQIKLYPCEVMEWTRIKEDHENGLHEPYGGGTSDKLAELLIEFKSRVPERIRLNRVVRDIPTTHIVAGNMDTGLRQVLHSKMAERGLKCRCIRCSEVKKREDVDPSAAVLYESSHQASGGTEYFLQFRSPDREVLFGFLRLRVSDHAGRKTRINDFGEVEEKEGALPIFPEIASLTWSRPQSPVASETDKTTSLRVGSPPRETMSAIRPSGPKGTTSSSSSLAGGWGEKCAMIRELHVYGATTAVRRDGDREHTGSKRQRVQHAGFGTRLLERAFEIARDLEGCDRISVISGQGVKPYYRRFGFVDGHYFMVKTLSEEASEEGENKIDRALFSEKTLCLIQ